MIELPHNWSYPTIVFLFVKFTESRAENIKTVMFNHKICMFTEEN